MDRVRLMLLRLSGREFQDVRPAKANAHWPYVAEGSQLNLLYKIKFKNGQTMKIKKTIATVLRSNG